MRRTRSRRPLLRSTSIEESQERKSRSESPPKRAHRPLNLSLIAENPRYHPLSAVAAFHAVIATMAILAGR
jgi:hypothetical protein